MKKIFLHVLPIALALTAVGCGVADYEKTSDMNEVYYDPSGIVPKINEEQTGDKFDEFKDNPFVKVADEPTSTFSVDADGASYAIMRRYISDGFRSIDPSSVRIEEFLNYFTFDYPAPTSDDAIAINAELGECPWNKEHHLLRLGIKGKGLTPNDVPLANYVFLVDVSGSMYSTDKLDLLKSGLIELVDYLNPDDRISIITYSGEVEKLLESTPVRDNANKIKKAIKRLNADGSTAGGKALQMAYEEALTNFDPKKNNRIIMGTDGDFNVGVTSTDALVEMVESYARKGIYMTCLGFGTGNLNDAMMEKISNAGNGTYNYIDCENEMMKVFVHERERFVSVANDTKCQVTFKPEFVAQYRLIGYENRVMSNEDFENDKKDAGEIGAGQTITALYEIVPADPERRWLIDSRTNHHVIASFDVRYKKSLDATSIPLATDIAIEDMYNDDITLKPMSANLSFAAGVAAYGMILRNSEYKGDATLQMASSLIEKSLSFDPYNRRAELLKLIGKYGKKDK